ncbi:MAG: hypothetical protein GXP53_13890, partial [Deltaproteobacteria bacterium]|nr:hypothetical protein [Deltaproteobacteria bacterium]
SGISVDDESNPDDPSIPCIALEYDEAGGIVGKLTIQEMTYVETTVDGLLRIRPPPDTIDADGSFLLLDLGPAYTISYDLTIISNNSCFGRTLTRQVESPEGIDLSALVSDAGGLSYIDSIDIDFHVTDASDVPVDFFISSMRIDVSDIAGVNDYPTVSGTRTLDHNTPLFTLFIKDGDREAFIVAHPMCRVTGRDADLYATVIPIPALSGLDKFRILVSGIDRMSSTRGPVALSVLSERDVVPDLTPPILSITSPANGTAVAPGQRLAMHVEINDDSNRITQLRVFENSGNLVREIGSPYLAPGLVIPYDVPAEYTSGQLNLLFVAEDAAGNRSSLPLVLPLVE